MGVDVGVDVVVVVVVVQEQGSVGVAVGWCCCAECSAVQWCVLCGALQRGRSRQTDRQTDAWGEVFPSLGSSGVAKERVKARPDWAW